MKDSKLVGAYSWAQPAHILLFQKPINPEQDRMTAYLRELQKSQQICGNRKAEL